MFLALVGLAVLFVFVRDNTVKVTVKFWDYATPEIELFLILIVTFVLGMLAASFSSTLKIIQLKRQLKNAGGVAGTGKKEVEKKKKGKDKKSAADEVVVKAPVSSAPEVTKVDNAEVEGSTVVASDNVTTDEDQAYKDVTETVDAVVCDVDASDVQEVDDVANDAPDRVIALPAVEADVEQTDRK